jgi:hypothetical protein
MSERPKQEPRESYPAEKARQGEIILRPPALRLIFIAGLVGAVVLALVIQWAAH